MNKIIILLILLTGNFLYLLGTVFYFKKILPSISDSYYAYKKTNKEFLFTLFIWFNTIGFILISPNILFTIGAFLLLLVPLNPLFRRNTFYNYLHSIGAIIGIGLAIISLVIYNSIYFPLILTILFILLYTKKNKIYWTEVVALLSILLSLFIIIL